MDHSFSPTEYEAIGKSYYKKKQYDKAVEAFTAGIDASVIPTAALYDYRAAAYEKLANFNAAIKDGRETIRLHKRDVRGYLRTGSVLQKLNKLDTAVNIYKYGMKNVPIDKKDFKLLQQLHDKLTRKLAPPKAIDPFAVLPVELIEMIIQYLSFKNMVNCLRVSRCWKQYLSARPKLWQNLNLAGATRPVSRVFIRHAVRYSDNDVRSLTIHHFQHTDVLRNVATICKHLHTVEILTFPHMLADSLIEVAQIAANLKKLVVRTNISMDTASQLLHHRPTLEHLELQVGHGSTGPSAQQNHPPSPHNDTYPHLHTLSLHYDGISYARINSFLQDLNGRAPNLQSLSVKDAGRSNGDLTHISLAPPLHSLALENLNLRTLLRLPSTLTSLVFHPRKPIPLSHLPNDNPALQNALLSHTAHLSHLSLEGVLDLSPQYLTALLDAYQDEQTGDVQPIQDARNLVSLALSGQLASSMRLFGPDGLCASPRLITGALRSLSVATLPCTDDDIEMLVALAENLEDVNVSATRVTGAGVKMLADGLPRLRVLKADDCMGISSRDAVAYAERKGVAVSCRMGGQKGGRKVRYG